MDFLEESALQFEYQKCMMGARVHSNPLLVYFSWQTLDILDTKIFLLPTQQKYRAEQAHLVSKWLTFW